MHTECGYMPTQAGLVKTTTKECKTEEIWDLRDLREPAV